MFGEAEGTDVDGVALAVLRGLGADDAVATAAIVGIVILDTGER